MSQRGSESQASPPGLAKPCSNCNLIPYVQVGNAPSGANLRSGGTFWSTLLPGPSPMYAPNSWGEEIQHFHRKKKKTLFKHKIFFYLSLKATHGHFCLFAFFFF